MRNSILGDERGAHITTHPTMSPIASSYIAVYRTELYGMCYPCGFGDTRAAAVRDLWRNLHDT